MTNALGPYDHCGCCGDCAAYVLGALDTGEARAFARHLERCGACRDEVAALTPVADSLALSVPALDVPKPLRRRVLRSVRAERQPVQYSAWPPEKTPARRWRRVRTGLRRPAVAGAVALASALVLALAGYSRLGTSGPAARTVRAGVGNAELRLAAGGRAELMVRKLAPAPSGRTYELWLQRGTRAPAPSTLFGVTSRGTADIGVPGGVAGVRRVLVTLEPAGGTRAPTTPPLISVRIA